MADFKGVLRSIEQLVVVVVCAAVVFFAFLNLQSTTVDLYFTRIEAAVALLILVPLLTGLVLGWMGGRLRARRKLKAAQAAAAGDWEGEELADEEELGDWATETTDG
jgi:uncharacterized integral membrane protein